MKESSMSKSLPDNTDVFIYVDELLESMEKRIYELNTQFEKQEYRDKTNISVNG